VHFVRDLRGLLDFPCKVATSAFLPQVGRASASNARAKSLATHLDEQVISVRSGAIDRLFGRDITNAKSMFGE